MPVVAGTVGFRPDAEPHPILVVGRDGALELDGVAARGADPVAAWLLDRMRHDEERTGVQYRLAVQVWADRDVTLSAIRALLAGADPMHRIVLLAEAPELAITPPVCPSSLGPTCDELERAPARERPSVIDRVWDVAVAGCAPLVALRRSLAEERVRRVDVPAALEQCGCAGVADGAAVMYLDELRLGGDLPPARSVPVPPEVDGSLTVAEFLAGIPPR